jgi:hypothetical protein
MRVMPWGTRRGGENFAGGLAGSGAQSLRASETSMKPCAQGERGMARRVGDGEHFVAQGGNQKQVHLGEDAAHLVGDLAPKAIGLHESPPRKESAPGERSWATRRAPAS